MKTQGNQMDFTGQTVFVGLDVHKDTWKAATCTQHTEPNRWPVTIRRPFEKNLKKYLDKHYKGAEFICSYEAGFCGFWIKEELEKIGLPTLVAHAADIPTSDKQRKQKEDKRDARKIAKCLKNGDIQGIYVPDKQAQCHRSLIRERYSIARSNRRVKNQIKSHLAFYHIEIPQEMVRKHWSRKFIDWLKTIRDEQKDEILELQLGRLEMIRTLQLKANRALRHLAKQSYPDLYEVLLSIPGLGPITTMLVITEIIDMKRFKNVDHLMSYVGLIPSTKSTGDRDIKGQITSRTNKRLRSGLVESAWSAIKGDAELLVKYENYRKTMTGQDAIVRITRILLRRIRRVWLSGQSYVKKEI